jgi:hypothetical protein
MSADTPVAAIVIRDPSTLPPTTESDHKTSSTSPILTPPPNSSDAPKPLRPADLAKLRSSIPYDERYSGEDPDQRLPSWLLDKKDMLRRLTQLEWERAHIAIGWFKGIAQQSILNENERRQQSGEPDLSWDEIQVFVARRFDSANTASKAITALSQLKMSAQYVRTVAEYNAMWYKHLYRIDPSEWDSQPLAVLYENGLWPKVRDLVKQLRLQQKLSFNPTTSVLKLPEPTVHDLMQLAIEVETLARDTTPTRYPSSSSSYSPPTSPPRRTYTVPSKHSSAGPALTVHYVSTSEAEPGANGSAEELNALSSGGKGPAGGKTPGIVSSSSAPKKKLYLPEEDRERLMRQGRCFSCYSKGHMRGACTGIPATSRPDFTHLN